MSSSDESASLPYHEPDIVTILILSSLLLSLNLVNHVLDRFIYCGLLGQIFLGILWGTPGAKWLDHDAETFIVNIGYLGLILLVYEGGLSTSFKSLKANLSLSVGIAVTGIALPIALSYVLISLAGATPLQAFAAGAALCSTSLGTTFTVLGTSGLITTRMGVLLSSAAMMDDVVGLVMVQVISNLGTSSTSSASSSFDAITVIRPVFVSLAFAIVVPLVARFMVQPFTTWLNARRAKDVPKWMASVLTTSRFAVIIHSLVLVGLVTGSSYAGTSNLFAAYLAGASISWWDLEVPHPSDDAVVDRTDSVSKQQNDTTTGEAVFTEYYQPALQRILRPFFFASIGFSIPITKMFTGTVVWKGIVYTILMAIGKLVCGVWLIRVSIPWPRWLTKPSHKQFKTNETQRTTNRTSAVEMEPVSKSSRREKDGQAPASQEFVSAVGSTTQSHPTPQRHASNTSRRLSAKTSTEHPHNTKVAPKPVSLYPAVIVGSAMTARGEIGFLISSLAESNGIFRQPSDPTSTTTQGPDEIFLVVTWAIALCTIVGPITVGLLVRRMNRLEKGAQETGRGRSEVLSVWG